LCHREIQDQRQRLALLKTTLIAQLKLAEEITPRELDTHASSPDPVAAALAARKTALQAVKDSYAKLLIDHADTEPTLDNMGAYYASLESTMKFKDPDMKKFQEVLEGERGVCELSGFGRGSFLAGGGGREAQPPYAQVTGAIAARAVRTVNRCGICCSKQAQMQCRAFHCRLPCCRVAAADTQSPAGATLKGLLCDRVCHTALLLLLLLMFPGKEDVWQYWFEHFSQQYAGLPGLGKLEDIYKQDEVSAVLISQV
jgi:hypothetical protein